MGYVRATLGPAPVKKFSEGFIQEALEKFFADNSVRYYMDNLHVFRWESDKLIETKTGYIYEFEIKISRADFKNDFKHKVEKHMILMGSKACGVEYLPSFTEWYNGLLERAKTSAYARSRLAYYEQDKERNRIDNQRKPNKFYYAVPDGLIQADEVPAYAGLIWVSNTGRLTEVKKAPYLHKDKYNDAELKLGEKFYYHMLDWKRAFWAERRAHARIAEKIRLEVNKKAQEKPYADLLAERDELKTCYQNKIDECLRLWKDKNDLMWRNKDVKRAMAEIIKKYEPDFNLVQFENEIYRKTQENGK